MNKIFLLLGLLLSFIASSCSPSESSIQTAIANTQTAQSGGVADEIGQETVRPTEDHFKKTMIVNQTKNAAYNATLEVKATNKALTPSPTKKPTNTLRPTSTPTPIPEPIILSGSGDSVVDIEKTFSLGIIHIIGPSIHDNFIVYNYDANNEKIDLLVNTIGEYDGYLPFDWKTDKETARFQIMASGPWTIEIYPFVSPFLDDFLTNVPGIVDGKGDSILMFPSRADLAIIDASKGDSNFIIYAYGDFGRELMVNEIAPYTGTVIIPSGTNTLEIKAEGDWTIELTE
jgi:hypothetical protein